MNSLVKIGFHTDFTDVTEVAGEPISGEQLERLNHRYLWAAQYCPGKDVVEVACGTGPGIGILSRASRSFHAGDFSSAMVQIARGHYAQRVAITQFDAQSLPFEDRSRDVIILFEAIYYVPDAMCFVAECGRVLRAGGRVLIATANKDLPGFNPSPHSSMYYGTRELTALFAQHGFGVELFGYLPSDSTSARQRLLRPVKTAAVSLGLMPKTMRGKRLLKRLVFGRPVTMPAELAGGCDFAVPSPLDSTLPDRRHKVLYCVATLKD